MSDTDRTSFNRRVLLRAGAAAGLAFAAARGAVGQSGSALKIGVIGSGHIGSTVGSLWVKAGHPVLFSSRHPEELASLVQGLGVLAKAGTVAEAVAFGEVIFIAVPYGAYPQTRQGLRQRACGQGGARCRQRSGGARRRDHQRGARGRHRRDLGEVFPRRTHRARIQYHELSHPRRPGRSAWRPHGHSAGRRRQGCADRGVDAGPRRRLRSRHYRATGSRQGFCAGRSALWPAAHRRGNAPSEPKR